jgi:hypothetical protein
MVVRFTLQLEDQTRKFYDEASKSNNFPQAKELFARFTYNSMKRKQELERAARESVDHSLLEPISGLSEESYTGTAEFSEAMSFTDVLTNAHQLEEKMQRFYGEAAEKISFISGVSRLYKRYAQDRSKALNALKSLQ